MHAGRYRAINAGQLQLHYVYRRKWEKRSTLHKIDIHVEVLAVQYADIASIIPGESSANIGLRIEAARTIQYKRFGKAKTSSNAFRMMSVGAS